MRKSQRTYWGLTLLAMALWLAGSLVLSNSQMEWRALVGWGLFVLGIVPLIFRTAITKRRRESDSREAPL
ncbi:hypothetical protein ACH0AG_08900 [Micrococcus luteus]|uniref:Uncharacterized protein n=1 Tax=Micrococcus luteus TaxID=1270 RepID=A0AAP3AH49_MICLU|nr:hypothetical protein [Micrococcus aloeverae]MBF0755221.1 hypothetical protein [Micrococcus aloeverae]MCV7629059.1 hypothetical protein [Micrococcus luteus]TFU83574.1 hypothetical protein E4T87_01875 [Micrococcus aloeverae]